MPNLTFRLLAALVSVSLLLDPAWAHRAAPHFPVAPLALQDGFSNQAMTSGYSAARFWRPLTRTALLTVTLLTAAKTPAALTPDSPQPQAGDYGSSRLPFSISHLTTARGVVWVLAVAGVLPGVLGEWSNLISITGIIVTVF